MSLDCSGLWVPLITPFNNDLSIDEKGLRELVDYFIDQGVDGLVPVGTTGESPTLDHDEHGKVIEIVVDQTAKRVPVMAGTGSNSTTEAISITKHAAEVGVDATLQVVPYYNKPSVVGLKAHFSAIAEATDLPMIIYNIPGRTGLNCPPNILLELGREVETIVGVKDAAADLLQTMAILEGSRDWDEPFYHLTGEDPMTYVNLTLGGHGAISAVSNVICPELVDMIALAKAGKWEECREVHFKVLGMIRLLFIEPNPVPAKEAMAMMGLPAGPPRLPLTPMLPENRAKLEQEMKKLGKI